MKWNELSPERRRSIVTAAAVRLDADEAAREPVVRADDAVVVTVADLADYARGRAVRTSEASIRLSLRADARLRRALDLLLDRYAKVAVPMAAAANSGGDPRKRRLATQGVEIEWLDSSAEPNTVIVRVHAPASMRPVKDLVLSGADGEMQSIPLVDDGGDIEKLLDRRSPEFILLADQSSKLWLR